MVDVAVCGGLILVVLVVVFAVVIVRHIVIRRVAESLAYDDFSLCFQGRLGGDLGQHAPGLAGVQDCGRRQSCRTYKFMPNDEMPPPRDLIATPSPGQRLSSSS